MTLRRSLPAVLVVAGLLLAGGRPEAASGDCLVVEDFSKAKVGEFPADWKVRDDPGKAVYAVQEDGGRRFLRADSQGLGIQAAKQFEWDLTAYPVLTWSWRPLTFPEGADERNSKTNDSVLAVYAVFPHWVPGTVKSVKYIWSARVPKDTHLTSSGGRTQARVVESGTARKGEWVEERVNVLEDYRRFFKTSDVPKAEGIAVLTDADDTRSRAQGDYASFRVCRP